MIKVVLTPQKEVKVTLKPEQGIQIDATKKYLFDPSVVQEYVDASADNAQIAIDKANEATNTFNDITVFVDNSKQELNQIVADGEVAIDGYVDAAEQEIKQIAQTAAEDAIQDAADEATRRAINQTTELVDNEIEPRLQEYASNADADAANAAESAEIASVAASDANHYAEDARIWAEGEQAEVEEIGGELSSRGFADFAMAIANTPEDVPLDQSKLIALNIFKGPKGDKGDKGDKGEDGIKGELNNPFSLFDYKWSEYKINNTSWLLSDGSFQDGTIYKSAYELLLNIRNGEEVKEGVNVKLSTESYTDTDFVVNTSNATFRLPVKVKQKFYNAISGNYPVVGNGTALGLTNGSSNFNLSYNTSSGNSDCFNRNNYGVAVGSVNSNPGGISNNHSAVGVTTDASKSGLVAKLSSTEVSGLYLYFYIGETIVGANIIDYTRELNEVVDNGIDRITQLSDTKIAEVAQASDNELAEIAQAGDTELSEITQAGEDGAELVRNTVEAILTGDKVLEGSLLIQTPPADDNSQRAVNSEWVNNALKDVGPSGGGLELGDIGIAISIDESKNKRRYLNGQTILQEQFVSFTSWVKERAELFPNAVTTEENWQAEVANSKLGQCGKFVIDDINSTIRLPKVVNLQGLMDLTHLGETVEAGLPNIEGKQGGFCARLGNLYSEGALSVITPSSQTGWSGASSSEIRDLVFDASTSNPIYGNSSTVQQEAIQYPYFIQVATGVEESVDVTREIELNNPFSLLDYKWSEYELNNASWLLSNGSFHSGATYVAVYELLLKIHNGTETKDGVSVKLSTEAYADTDFVINTADTTFRLPIKVKLASGNAVVGNGNKFGLTNLNNNNEYNLTTFVTGNGYGLALGTSGVSSDNIGVTTNPTKSGIETSSSGLKLYFYVGETIQDANLINIGKLAELVSKLDTIDYVVDSYDDGTDWFRVYRSGWVEQGGRTVVTNKEKTLKLFKSYRSSEYYVSVSATWSSSATGHNEGSVIVSPSQVRLTTDFTGDCVCFWEAKGMGAK